MRNRIKELRNNLNLTQEQMAEILHVSRQTVISIENGRFNPSLKLAYKIAQLFSCAIEDVFDFENERG